MPSAMVVEGRSRHRSALDTEINRLAVFGKEEKGLYSHSAFIGTLAYIRGSEKLVRVELGVNS